MSLKEMLIDRLQKALHSDQIRITSDDIQEMRTTPADQKDMLVGKINQRLECAYNKGLTAEEYEALFKDPS